MRILHGALLALTVFACGEEKATGPGAQSPGSGGQATTTSGSTASDFSARDIDGKTVKLSEYLGKNAIVLNFWATWCEPCVAEFPHLRRMYDANKAKGLVILGVAMDGPESVANVAPFARRQQLNFPVLLDEDSHVAQLYNPKKSAPLSVLIDKQGRIFKVREGYNPGDEEFFAQDVAKMLDSGAAPK
jgi:peroxiredoxin